MVRRVKAYLKNMKVITDEEKLHAMSLECEPPIGGLSAASTIQIPQSSVRILPFSLTPKKHYLVLFSILVTKTKPKPYTISS